MQPEIYSKRFEEIEEIKQKTKPKMIDFDVLLKTTSILKENYSELLNKLKKENEEKYNECIKKQNTIIKKLWRKEHKRSFKNFTEVYLNKHHPEIVCAISKEREKASVEWWKTQDLKVSLRIDKILYKSGISRIKQILSNQ